jgi:ribokinase
VVSGGAAVTLDVAVVGTPFLDLTFEGLPRLPRLGEEIVARALHVGPGGTGMQALGTARLGLETALVAPIGRSGAAALLRTTFESDGVRIVGDGPAPTSQEELERHTGSGLPTTALLATKEGVAMATALGGREPDPEDVTTLSVRAAIIPLGRLPLAPTGAAIYAVTGGLELAHVDSTEERLAPARALLLNAGEACSLTGQGDAADAARALARRVATAVVTMGAEGVLAVEGDRATWAPAPQVQTRDATGAGDLFAAAYVWADLGGAGLADRLGWAALYAGLSVRAPTAFAGALHLEELLAEGRSRGLAAPPRYVNR